MPDSIGSFVKGAACAACLFLIVAAPVAAQPPVTAPATPQFMSRYDFHLSAAALASGDIRFAWDTHFGGDFDFVDYVHGRVFFLADYQALLGNEFRPFDPYEGNYFLEAAGSVRAGATEFVGVLHHTSRHVGDRPKRFPIAWNKLDARVLRQVAVGGSTIDVRVAAGKVIARANVDYSWTGNLDVTVRHPLRPHVGLFGGAAGHLIGVIATSSRERQKGGRLEAGVRLMGQGGAIELFAGVERVIDADTFDGIPRQWAFAGFRMVPR